MTSTTAEVSEVEPSAFAWDAASGPAAGVRHVVTEASRADGRSPLNEQALLSLRHSGLASSNLWVAERDGEVVGFALVGAPDPESVEVDLVVGPRFRGEGVGTSLAEAVAEAPPGAAVTAWSHGNHPGAAALASALGLDRVRDLWVMRRPMAGELPPVVTPDHTDVRTFEPGRDEDAFLALNAAAFANHPEQGDMTRADLDRRIAEPWFDPSGFFLAEAATGELLGFHWTKVHEEDPPYGEVYVVGVSPTAQGMGLGRVLTLAGLHHLRALGLPEVILYVESDNAPAIAVYERLGFTHADEDTDVMYSRGPAG